MYTLLSVSVSGRFPIIVHELVDFKLSKINYITCECSYDLRSNNS